MKLLLRRVEVEGALTDVLVEDGRVAVAGPVCDLKPDDVIDGQGGALLPGLHDHHLHLLALAAARESVDVSTSLEALCAAPGTGWVRGVQARVSVDRHVLDALVPDRPVRVQHRSGGLWMLNSAGLRDVATVLDDSVDVDRDERGHPTGRLWRYDERLRPALPPVDHDLNAVVDELHSYGITSVTDATPELDPETVSTLSGLHIPVSLLGDPYGVAPLKLLLHDHDLPSYDELVARVGGAHAVGRPIAVHCVTRESLLLILAVLDDTGRLPGDRIEHAAVVPPEVRERLRGLLVVTQPAMLVARAREYARDVHPEDRPCLFPFASLLAQGVDVHASSDAPFGPLDPWEVLRAARDRDLVPAERVSTAEALSGYLAGRRVEVGATAGLCLLHVPLREALATPDAGSVRMTIPAVVGTG